MTTISQKPVALVVGASRGIGRQIAIDLAKNGYAVVVAAKSSSDPNVPLPDPLPGPNSPESTITTVTREIHLLGGEAIAVRVDVRSPESVDLLISKTIAAYGRLDALIYNSGAIYWAPVSSTPLQRFQLMQRVNPEGLYATVQAALPHLISTAKSQSPSPNPSISNGARIVVVSPPIYSRFFRGKTAYAMGKIGMSVLVQGLAMDLERQGLDASMAVSAIWPAVAIQSAATEKFTTANPDEANDLRHPTIFADAILAILAADPQRVNGRLLLDEDFLRDEAGVEDFDKYSIVPGSKPRRIMPRQLPDLTVDEQDDEGKRYDSSVAEANKAKTKL